MRRTKRIKVSKNFYLDEYVTEEFYQKWGKKCLWWIRPELITSDQFIRKRFGKVILINTWIHGGNRRQSGLRYPEAHIGADDSLHEFGCASDKSFLGVTPYFYDEVREDIKINFKRLYKPLGLTTIEKGTPSWLHTDCRNIDLDYVKIV